MEEQKLHARKFIINYGILLGLISIVLSVIMYVMNMHMTQNWIAGLLGFIAMVIVIVLGINQYKKSNGSYLTLSQAIKIGVGIALIAGIMGAIYQLIFINFIEPDFIENMMEMQYNQMIEKNPNMSKEQLEMSIEMGKKFSSPWITSAISIIASLFFGLIISLFAGLVMKKENTHA